MNLVTYTAADGLGLAERRTDGAVYYGIIRHIPREHYDRRRAAILEWDLSASELDALYSPVRLSDCTMEPVPGTQIERVVTLDHGTGNFMVLYRIAFRKAEP
jgi:hypothetical protein